MSPGLLSVDDDKGPPPLSSPTVSGSAFRHQELLHPVLLDIAHKRLKAHRSWDPGQQEKKPPGDCSGSQVAVE